MYERTTPRQVSRPLGRRRIRRRRRIGPSGQRSFFPRRKLPTGKGRSVTLTSADRMSAAEARREAHRVLVPLLDVPEEEHGPRYPGRPMAEFADEFLERYAQQWKPNTLDSSAHSIRKHIVPALGHLAVDTILFDRALPGSGLRIHPSGPKVYIVRARFDGRSRRMVIARHSDMGLAEEHRRARELLARIRAGTNPAEERGWARASAASLPRQWPDTASGRMVREG